MKPELNSTFQSQILDDAESAPVVKGKVRESEQFQNVKKTRTHIDIEKLNTS